MAENKNLDTQEKETKQYIVVRIGGEKFGIDIGYVDNIVRMQKITRVPKAQVYFKGIINLRGEIVPVMSARIKMGLEDDAEHKICDKIPSYMNNKDNMLDIDEYKMEIASVGNYRKNGKGVVLFRRKYPIFYFMKIYFENGRTVADYFKHPVIHNILHGNEEMLYDCICNFNCIRLKK